MRWSVLLSLAVMVVGSDPPLEPVVERPEETAVDPNRALYKAVKGKNIDEREAAIEVRAALAKGASPMRHGMTKNEKNKKLTPVEIALKSRRPVVVEALFEDPSPISYEALEELVKKHPDMRWKVDRFRTKIAREVFALTRFVEDRNDDSGAKMLETVTEAKIFVFAEEYLNNLSLMVVYLTVVLLLISLLYQLRIKQSPNPEVLMTPREEDTLWTLLRMGVSTVTTSIPTSNWFEIIGYGLALGGGMVWSQIFTSRNDLGLCLALVTIIQSMLTLICYISFAPMASPGDDIYSRTVHKIMFYPKKSDWNRAVVRTAYYAVACGFTFYVLFYALDPINKMYYCPSKAISDTYGFDFTVTRTVAMMWDVIIFFNFALRVFRTMDTVIAFDLFKRLASSDPDTSSQDDKIVISNP